VTGILATYSGASNIPNQRLRSGSNGSSRSSFAFSSSSSAFSTGETVFPP
jgi:hypothetical protein